MTTRPLLYPLSELLQREADAARRAGLTLEERGELEAYAEAAAGLEADLAEALENLEKATAERDTAIEQVADRDTLISDLEKERQEAFEEQDDLETRVINAESDLEELRQIHDKQTKEYAETRAHLAEALDQADAIQATITQMLQKTR